MRDKERNYKKCAFAIFSPFKYDSDFAQNLEKGKIGHFKIATAMTQNPLIHK